MPVHAALADCNNGTPASETITCSGADTDGVLGGGGTDTVIVEPGATVNNPTGDGINITAGTVTTYGDVSGSLNGIANNSGNVTTQGDTTGGVYDISNSGGDVITQGDTTGGVLGILNSGGDVITNGDTTGGVFGIYTPDPGSGSPDNTVTLGNGTVTSGGTAAVFTKSGNDTVVLGTGGVAYGTTCGDIKVTTVQQGVAPTVNGLIDGGADSDRLVLNYFTPNQAEFDAFAANAQGSGVYEWDGQTYTIANFEAVSWGGVYTEGATRLFDDGVVLAFASAGGIVVCSGKGGVRAGTIDFATLDAGQTSFNAGNGWSVTVSSLGSGRYQVRLFDSSGKEHFNDTDHNGLADSGFTFSR